MPKDRSAQAYARHCLKQFYAFLESFVIVALVISGLAGLFHSALRAGGWLDAAWEYLAPIIFTNVTTSLIVASIAVFAFVWWHDRHVVKGSYNKRIPTVVMFVLMAAGAFYIGRYAIFGTL